MVTPDPSRLHRSLVVGVAPLPHPEGGVLPGRVDAATMAERLRQGSVGEVLTSDASHASSSSSLHTDQGVWLRVMAWLQAKGFPAELGADSAATVLLMSPARSIDVMLPAHGDVPPTLDTHLSS